MNRLNRLLRRIFLPPPESSVLRRYGPWGVLFGVPLLILLIVPATWEYTNSPSFCGETCHTMPPEYQTYLVSPHARVPCVDCHIGRGSVYEKFVRKTGHTQLLIDTVLNNYEYPIFVSEMRPARDSCELCHFPEKFSDDSLRSIQHFENDEENSPYTIYLLMHTGGGSEREGLGQGIHWHVENRIEYVALDKLEQDIPWIRVNRADGTTEVYATEDSPVTETNLGEFTVHEMDCITCHNRISHHLLSPTKAVDTALARGDISTDIPNIREQSIELLSQEFESTEEAHDTLASLTSIYEDNYPDFYATNEADITQAIDILEQIYEENNYPEQELDWETHPNNIGHRDWPGCFRCHDGEHFEQETQEAIRLECNLCHSIPTVVRPGEIEPTLPLTTGFEPSSHLSSTWISRHHNEFDETCANCHTIENLGGTTDTSFCSNSGCHGVDWRYAGFDAPTLRIELGMDEESDETPVVSPDELGGPITYQTLLPLFEQQCAACHGASPTKGLRVTDFESLMAGSEDGPVIVPNEPDESSIVEVLTAGHFAQFTPDQMIMLRDWIADGAPEGEGATEEPDTSDETETALTYQTLQPILEEACGLCHSGDSPQKGLRVTDYESLIEGSEDGPVIVPNEPDESHILEVLTEGHYGQLTDEQMELLTAWIEGGAPEDEGSTADTEDAEASDGEEAEPAATSAKAVTTYQTLQPILEETCGMCHSGDTPPKGLNVTDYESLMAGGEDGPVIVPNEPEESPILEVLDEGHFAQFTDEQMELLTEWIAAGAPEDEDSISGAGEADAATTYQMLQPILEETCGMCHSGDTPAKGLTVTDYESLMIGGEDGPVIEPNEPEESHILEVLGAGHFAKLTDEQMELLTEWIAAGAPEGESTAVSEEAADEE